MKLWLLRVSAEGGPIYDAYCGHVVAASSEERARKLANTNPGDEGSIWEDAGKVSCQHIGESVDEEEGIVLSDFHPG